VLNFTFQAPVYDWKGEDAFVFVSLPGDISAAILAEDQARPRRKPGTSIPVVALVGGTRWKTSVSLDKKAGTYRLAIKAAVRDQEQLQVGEMIEVGMVIDFA
jgi:hypothetical protein